MALYQNITQSIGNTPIIRLSKLDSGTGAQIYGKIESRNPGGSVKDRAALFMIEEAERQGLLKPGMKIIEPTSGNTGIGLAMVAAVKGYGTVLVMPENMSVERRNILLAYGASLVLTEGAKANMAGAIEKAKAISEADSGYFFMPQQFRNMANVLAHRNTTAQEILRDLPDLDVFVSGVGTGGTISGVGQMLAEAGKNVLIVAVEPGESPVLSGGAPGKHSIQGIGTGFVPPILDRSVIGRIERVTGGQARAYQRELALKEGIFAGHSSGAAIAAAKRLAVELGAGIKILAILPDTGERYLSME